MARPQPAVLALVAGRARVARVTRTARVTVVAVIAAITAIALTTVVGCTGCVGCNQAEKRTVELLNQGVRALNQANYLYARGRFRKALEIAPNDPDANFYLGFLYLRQGEAEQARKHLETSMVGDPARPDGWLHLARACYRMRDYKATQEALKKLFALDELSPDGHYLWARIAAKAHKLEVEDAHLRRAIEGDPGYAPAYLELGGLYSDVGAYEAALKVLQEGMRFSPGNIHLQQAYGLAWMDVGRPDRAKDVFAVAEKNPRADYTLHLNYAAALLQLGDQQKAIKQLEQYLILGRHHAGKRELNAAARMLLKLKRG